MSVVLKEAKCGFCVGKSPLLLIVLRSVLFVEAKNTTAGRVQISIRLADKNIIRMSEL